MGSVFRNSKIDFFEYISIKSTSKVGYKGSRCYEKNDIINLKKIFFDNCENINLNCQNLKNFEFDVICNYLEKINHTKMNRNLLQKWKGIFQTVFRALLKDINQFSMENVDGILANIVEEFNVNEMVVETYIH